jgi:hypothetical protein
MSISIGRRAWLGVAIEASPGSAKAAAKYLPFLTCTLRGVQEPLVDESAKGLRERVGGSVLGPKRGEGDAEILLDVENAPYLIYPALGVCSSTQITTNSYTHTITRIASNTPKTLTLIHDNIAEIRKFVYGVVNTLEISVSDGLARATAGILSKFPATGTGTKAITSETVLSFKDYKLYLGTTYSTLKAQVLGGTGVPTKITNFTLRINNNAEAQHVSGDNDVDSITLGQLEVDGEYTLFFETTTERAAYEALTKRALIVQFIGGAIGSDYEEIFIGLPLVHLRERAIDTAIAGFMTESPTFVAEYDTVEAKSIEVLVTNNTVSY